MRPTWQDVAARIGANHYGPAVLAARKVAGFEEPMFREPAFAYKCGPEDHGPRYRATALYLALKKGSAMKPLIGLVTMLLLTGCTAPISKNPLAALGHSGVIAQGLLDASYNFDQAVAVGALDSFDPAPMCLHGILIDLGIDPASPPAASFTPRISDLISQGSVLYIHAQQVKRLQGGVAIPDDCKALVGQIVMDAAAAGVKVVPGGGLLPMLR